MRISITRIFYWRLELQPEAAATIHGPTTIGNDALEMTVNRYRNAVGAGLRGGRGAGQETDHHGEFGHGADGWRRRGL